jgi:hypothetical protein
MHALVITLLHCLIQKHFVWQALVWSADTLLIETRVNVNHDLASDSRITRGVP